MSCVGCGKKIDQKSVQRWPGVTVCQSCRSNPKVYYYERLLRQTLSLTKRDSGAPRRVGMQYTGDELVFETVKNYLPFHLYWDGSSRIQDFDRQEVMAFYERLTGHNAPYKLVRWYAEAHNHPPKP